jgi:hypothetical protein
MEFWTAQLALAQQQINEIRDKIAQQQEKADALRRQGLDPGLNVRLSAVMEDSLARARMHAAYIQERITVLKDEAGWQRRGERARRSAARKVAGRQAGPA